MVGFGRLLQPVARRDAKVGQGLGGVEQPEASLQQYCCETSAWAARALARNGHRQPC
jgi:hypothetical protein